MKGLFIPGHKRPESCNDCIANNDCYKCNVLDEVFEDGWADIKPPAECLIFEIDTDDWVSRRYLLEEYDRQHVGPPGGARKIIEEAPPALENSDPNEVYSDKAAFERAIKALEFAEEALRQLNRIMESGGCNDCANRKDCQNCPPLGQLIRFNCMFYKKEKENEQST